MRSAASHPGLRRFHGFWFCSLDPFILGCFRFALGFVVLFLLLLLAPTWVEYYGVDGISPYPVDSWRSLGLRCPWLFRITTDTGLWAYYASNVIAAVSLLAGWLPRLASAWLWWTFVSLIFRSPVNNGEEQVLCALLFFSMFLPLDALKLKDLMRRDRLQRALSPRPPVEAWILTTVQIHFMLMYLLSLPSKLISDIAWRDGTAVYYAMMAMNYPRWPGLEVFAWGSAFVSKLLTFGTIVVEGLPPLLVWARRLRTPCVLLLMGLHAGLALLLSGVTAFNVACLVGLILFLPSRRTRELVHAALFERSALRDRLRSWLLG